MASIIFSKGMFYVVAAQIMVACNIVISKSLIASMPILIMMNIRFGLAAIILFPLHWLTPARTTPFLQHFRCLSSKDWGFLVAQALSAGVLFNCLMLKGLHSTDANIAGIITSALPAMIAVFSLIFLKETLTLKKSLCIVLATVGLLVIAYDKFKTVGAEHSFIGDAIILLSLIPEAGYYILTKLHTTKLPIFLVSSLLNGINALLLLPLSLSLHWDPSTLTFTTWFILFILGISAGLFYTFWLLGSERIEGMLASLATATMPVATVLIAWLALGEGMNVYETTGLGLVLLSIYVYARR